MKKAVSLKAWGVIFFALALSGCTMIEPDNNYRHPADFARHLQNDGFKIAAVRPLDPRPLAAAEALELTIGNSNIGVYKYDINNKLQRKRLEKIKREKRIYFIGIPYPIYEVSGSFIVVGLDKHKEKKRILESLRNFK